ncbi:substrate-binding periplasmic protein [Thalassotalea profundi]|uniref:Solute-binding protein family 3/N-terminal domain-containing protein n=1 Tax=Thalassotalea profundi TaxID=2036687 RepID=A0ABQ3IYB1_9GAMM|nr:transporter substrate-binding domain-containing protein [Thalassotalea profundi]GHE98406.1 hypothetical protein GCM10011501_29930 [Thalassotalea profundi]
MSHSILRNFFLANIILVVSNSINLALANDKIQVVTENWYPYNYTNKNGSIVGKSTAVVKKILAQSTLDYSIEAFPWTRAFNLSTTQPNVLIYSILRTPNREKLFHWFCPISTQEPHRIYKLTNRNDITVNTEKDIKNYTISATRGTFLHQYMVGLGFIDEVNLQVTSDDEVATTLFLAGRVDLLADFESSIERSLKERRLDKSMVTQLFIIPAENYPANCMALSKQTSTDVVNKIRKAHQDVMSQG